MQAQFFSIFVLKTFSTKQCSSLFVCALFGFPEKQSFDGIVLVQVAVAFLIIIPRRVWGTWSSLDFFVWFIITLNMTFLCLKWWLKHC